MKSNGKKKNFLNVEKFMKPIFMFESTKFFCCFEYALNIFSQDSLHNNLFLYVHRTCTIEQKQGIICAILRLLQNILA
jgi:hypothetical protein